MGSLARVPCRPPSRTVSSVRNVQDRRIAPAYGPGMDLRLSVIGLVVADMATTLAFYRRLGLELPADADAAPHVEVEVGGLRLAFDTEEVIRSFDPGYVRPQGGSQRMSLAFACPSPAEVDAAYAQLTGAGHEGVLAPWDADWGMRYAVVHDPDGTPVDLFASLPG